MKRTLKTTWLLLLTALLSACGSTTSSTPTSGAASSATTDGVADLNDGKTRIALLISGDLGDMSFFDSANSGMLKFKADHPECDVSVIEMGGSDTSKWESTLTQTANQAYDLIICGTTDMREPLQRLVKKTKYADRRFIIFDTEIKDNAAADYPTVHSMMFSQNEGGYLAGALCSLLSKESGAANTAFIGGGKNDIINDFGYGFMQGVKDTNAAKSQKVLAYNSYIGDFTNSPKGKSTADSFYTSGVNILFAAASQAGLGCIDSAKNNNKDIVGVDSDQYAYYKDSDPEKAKHIVTSVLKRVDLALDEACESFLKGTLKYGVLETLGIKEGKIGLADNENYRTTISKDDRDYLATLSSNIANGTLTVKSGLKRYTTSEELNALYDELDPNKQA
jgi:basic membrane protein A